MMLTFRFMIKRVVRFLILLNGRSSFSSLLLVSEKHTTERESMSEVFLRFMGIYFFFIFV